MNNGIQEKVVVITDASSGIGESTARHLSAKGANLVLGARRLDRLEKLAAELRGAGGKVEVLTTDVTRRQDVAALVKLAVSKFGRIDVLVNNAGIMPLAPFSALKIDEWDAMIDVNIKGVLYGIAAALPEFQKQKSGHFVNLSSVAGIKVFSPGGSVYSGTKFAVRAISDGLRHEVGKDIRTTIILPGLVDSELKHNTTHKETSEGVLQLYQIAIPSDAVARSIVYAIEQPADVDINEIVLRPTAQDF